MKTNTEAVHFLNALVTNMDSGILSFDMKGNVTLANVKALEYLQIDKRVNQVIDSNILEHIGIPELEKLIENCISKSRIDFHISNVYFNDKYLIIDGKKLLDGMLLSITDVTADVLEKDRATQSLIWGQETERRRLAREIHDGVGPSMSSLILQLDAVKRKLENEDHKESIEKITKGISEIAQEIRQISHDLMPSSLIDFGLVTALSNFSNTISSTGDIKIEYHSNITDKSIPQEYELNIYRIVQELVNNAIKYSQCKSIQINLLRNEDTIRVFVQDDGIGMNAEKSKVGIGLHNVSTRVESLQGNLEINSPLGSGVTTHIEFPLKNHLISDK